MSDFGTMLDPHSIRFERLLPGPLERVWNFLTKSENLATWLAQAEVELRVGGRVELHFDVDEAPGRKKVGSLIRGVVTRGEPPRLLEYTWVVPAPAESPSAERPVPDTIVTFELHPRGQDVLLVLTHRRLPSALIPRFGAGWHTHLEVLKARMSGEAPEAFLAVFDRVLPGYEQQAAKRETRGQ